MMISAEEATAVLIAPRQPFELDEVVVGGVRLRVWKQAPPNGRSLLEASRAHADKVFVVFGDERLSFAQHFGQVATLAHRLVDVCGVRKGDRVAIAMRNLPEWIVAFWAALSTGAVVVPLNGWWTGPELDYGLRDSGAKVLFADPQRLARLADYLPGQPLEAVVVARGEVTVAGQARSAGRPWHRPVGGVATRRRPPAGRRRHHLVHLGHDGTAEGGSGHPSQHLYQRVERRL